ncbi:MAG: hypothetical protein ABIT69_08685 [Sphingomicrobium sp.]
MKKSLIILAALASAFATPAIAQQSSLKMGGLWNASRILVEDGQGQNYRDYLAKTWVPNQEFAKAQGWIQDYYILDNINARDGEPNIILLTRYADFPSVAEMERRNGVMNQRMSLDDHSAAVASGSRNVMRKQLGTVLYRELTKR